MSSLSKKAKKNIWSKAESIPGKDQNVWRRDMYGETICKASYGDRNSEFGWDTLPNKDEKDLIPVHYKNYAKKSR